MDKPLAHRIERVAPIVVPMLIHGETDTGKELVAPAIWERSARRHRRLETINAGALNRELLLSELFGHERGAFTGAIVRKPGLLTVADGGTVFLDEVGDVPLDTQVMLLRFLQPRWTPESRPVVDRPKPASGSGVPSMSLLPRSIVIEQASFRR